MGIDASRVLVRPAAGLELRAAMMLLPAAVCHRPDNDYWVAVSEKPLRFLAAAASCGSVSLEGYPQLHFDLHVAAPYRLQGVGRRLVERLRTEALQRQAVSLVTSFDPAVGEGFRKFLERVGFEPVDRLVTYEVDTRRLADYVLSLRDWLVKRGAIPAGVRIIPLREASDLPALARLHAGHLAGTLENSTNLLQSLLAGPMADHNIVLLVDGEVAGLMITETYEGFSEVMATVVVPTFRAHNVGGGWANVVMMADRLEWGLSLGSRRCRFGGLEAARATRKLAQQSGAECVSVAEFYRLMLERGRPGRSSADPRTMGP